MRRYFGATRSLQPISNPELLVLDMCQYKSDAQYSLADISIIHVHVLEYGGVEIASQLGEEEEDEGDGAGRAVSTASFITNLFHPVVEIVRYALPKRQVCPPRRAVKEEFLSRVVDVCTSFSVSIRARDR
ncbi:uncharacterized protein LOC112456876 [Temnothorax curvispinosus]|uniref:Uncharacterized protein LOC112456876 n=1 Tax=Temnothorax curvispinosus TaxID=300111 RepID=A0A6J1PZU8_9HYME|nr:uncharacterized protein LOC112456876 [Temnothorax curvispinosus]